MSSMRLGFLPVSFAVVSLAVLSGCETGPGATATIRYSQVGACNGYRTGSGATAARPNAAFVVFEIEAIDNTKSNVEFRFVPSRVFVNLAPEHTFGSDLVNRHYYAATDRRLTDPLGLAALEPVRVSARAKAEVDRFVFVPVGTAEENGSAEASRISYGLSYDAETGKLHSVDPDPHVEFVKANTTQTKWDRTDECDSLQLSAKK